MTLRRALVNFFLVLALMFLIFKPLCRDTWASPDLPVHNVNTGRGYSTIQEAIDANETFDGHTIHVDAGTYYEGVVVNKSLSLIGQDKYTTMIDANGSQTAVQVNAKNVTITGFTLQNSNTTAGYGAIQLYYSQDNNISNNIIRNTWFGIYIYNSLNNIITNNQAFNNSYSGINLERSKGNNISYCDVSDNENAGIFLYGSSVNQISNNIISRQKSGISLTESDANVIRDNNISAVDAGIYISNSNNNLAQNNSASGSKYGIHISNSRGNTASNNNVSSNKINGIRLESSTDNIILNNTLQNNTQAGVFLSLSSNNILLHNIASANQYGVQLISVDNCTFNENEVVQNAYGIAFSESGNNRLWNNRAQDNGCGIQFDRSNNNTLLDNNFINNTQQLVSNSSTNYLDNGIEGNYWANYNGTDANQDAIGDKPYTLAEDNVDNYPLLGPFSYYVISSEGESYYLNLITNSRISEILYDNNARIMNFTVTGPDGTTGFCRLPIPKILISAPQVVLVDEQDVNAKSLPISNSTHTFLCFTYALSNHQVTIVSEMYYEYHKLLTEFIELNSTYNKLVTDYNELNGKYGQLNATYYQLTGDYETLQSSYEALVASYTSLNSTYNSLKASFEELSNIRTLTYALLAGIIILAVVLIPTNIMFRRKINKQNKIIEAYNPLELARTLFMEDVKNRGAKIDKFQSKYGVKIQTRNTLEDVIKSLEKEKKKQ